MVEADESDGTFLSVVPDIAVVTNIEADHLDHYGSFDAVRSAFESSSWTALSRITGSWGETTPRPPPSAGTAGADVVGTTPECTHRIVDLELARSSHRLRPGGPVRRRELGTAWPCPVPGLHNAKNAAVATVAALAVGVPFATA